MASPQPPTPMMCIVGVIDDDRSPGVALRPITLGGTEVWVGSRFWGRVSLKMFPGKKAQEGDDRTLYCVRVAYRHVGILNHGLTLRHPNWEWEWVVSFGIINISTSDVETWGTHRVRRDQRGGRRERLPDLWVKENETVFQP